MFNQLFSVYRVSYSKTLVYMLQACEYQIKPYIKWLHRTKDFSHVAYRRDLVRTKAARGLLYALRLGITLEILIGGLLIYLGIEKTLSGGIFFGAILIIIYPFVWAYLLTAPLIIGRYVVSKPMSERELQTASLILKNHPAIKLAVAGSYGKTTMKELLNCVLSQKLAVAATPANKNVSISHAKFAKNLTGKEDVLIIEYGEGAPGDVMRYANLTHPTHGVITGLAPAHLDSYKTLKAAGQDLFSLADYLKSKNIYAYEDEASQSFLKDSFNIFNSEGALGWQIKNIRTDLGGTSFVIKKAKRTIELKSLLVGRHQVAYLAFVAAFAIHLGLSEEQVISGIGKTKPFEHRLQPYQLSGAWILDDTYNGNLEGIKAGTALLAELEAKRKIYVTPGLVDQGEETERVHIKIGEFIAKANPDLVVLMNNSVTQYIKQGLKQAGFKGELQVKDDPLEFYVNLKHFVATGDLVVMQNDWPDNYI
jgi:UDP-N-acetylmuramoyl-tripeptide--D-alanyl-D-alanine ligase